MTPALAANPVANDESASVRQDKPLDIWLDAYDDDFDTLTYVITDPPDNGTLSENCADDGFCVYTPDPGFVGSDAFMWKANDGGADSNVATYDITVLANTAPTAADQSESVTEDTPTSIILDVIDDDGDDVVITITDPPDHGSLDACPNGLCLYTPDADYTGMDAFTWTASDDLAATSAPATVTITVTSNIAPVADDQAQALGGDKVAPIFLDATDGDGHLLTYAIITGPVHGDLDPVDCPGACTYTPDPGYAGPDSFTWKANDGQADSNTATFSLTILPVTVTTVSNDASGAAAVAAAMVRDPAQLTAASFVSVPSTGTPNGTSTALGAFPTHGSTFGILTSGDASLADDPNDSGFSGVGIGGGNVRGDTDFDVTILRLDLTAPAGANCLRLDFAFYSDEYPEWVGSSFNDAFIAELDTTTWTTSGSTILAPDNFAFDAAGDVISINSTGATGMNAANATGTTYDGATVLLRAATQVAPGPHSLYLSVFDQGDDILDSAAFIDNIRFVTVGDPGVDCAEGAEPPTNTNPVAVADSATTPFGTAIDIDVLGNDSDPDGDTVTVTSATVPANGATSINPDGTVKYTPDAGFSGEDTFDYTISDGEGGTATATVTVTVQAETANPAPTADAGGPYTGTEGSPISLDGTVTNEPASDTVTTTWSYTLGAGTDAGMTCSFGNASNVDTTITCTDDGTVTVKLTANDGVNTPATEDTAVVTIANADPTVSITSPADAAGFQTGATVNLSASISDAGANDTHTCSIDWGDSTVEAGTVAAGVCTGSHSYGATGAKTITVAVTDDDAGQGTDTVGITITAPPANPAPTADAGGPYTGTEGSPISLDGTVTNEPASDTVTTTWSYTLGAGTDAGMTCSFGNASNVDTTITCTDDGTVTVKLTANDGVNTPATEDTAVVTIANADPTVSITSPADTSGVNVGATVNLTASRGDPGSNDTHTCSIDWGDGTVEAGTLTATTCTGSHQYAAIGVPTITVTITDDDGGEATDEIMLVVSAPGSKVTGGGWISHAGGKLRFGLVAKGSEGEIQVRWGTHRFHGKTVSGLVVAKPQASWTGTGRYDGDAGYTYEVTVRDNGNGGGKQKTPDTFAIVIRDSSGAVVFSASGPLGGGNLKVH